MVDMNYILSYINFHSIPVELVNASGENVKDVAKRFGKTQCVELLGGYTEDEEEETSPEGKHKENLSIKL